MANLGQGAKGALGGAAAGAAFGPVGIGAGALLGGLGGLFGGGGGAEVDKSLYDLPGYGQREGQYQDLYGEGGSRGAFTSSGAQLGAEAMGGFRNQQGDLANMLWRRARGEESLAAEQARQSAQTGIAQQQALAAGARGVGAAGAQRMAAQNAANITSGLAGTSAAARLAESQAAAGALGGVLQGARGQDIAALTENARLAQQNNQFNVGAQYQNRSMNDALRLQALQGSLSNAQLQQMGMMGYSRDSLGQANQPGFGDMLLGQGMNAFGGVIQNYMNRPQPGAGPGGIPLPYGAIGGGQGVGMGMGGGAYSSLSPGAWRGNPADGLGGGPGWSGGNW